MTYAIQIKTTVVWLFYVKILQISKYFNKYGLKYLILHNYLFYKSLIPILEYVSEITLIKEYEQKILKVNLALFKY